MVKNRTKRSDQAITLRRRAARMRRIDGLRSMAEMVENPLNHCGLLDAGDHPQLPAALSAGLNVDGEYPLEALCPRHRPLPVADRYLTTCCASGGACPGHDPCPVAARRCEHAVVPANALDTGTYLVAGLRSLAERFECIGDVRGSGLFLGVDLVNDRATREPATKLAHTVVNALREQGVLTNTIGKHANILKLRPPMPFSRADADYFLERMEAALC